MARANMAKKGGKIHFHLPFFFTVLHFPGKTSFARRDTLKNIYEEELNGWKVNEFFNLPLLYVSQYEGVSFFYFFFFFEIMETITLKIMSLQRLYYLMRHYYENASFVNVKKKTEFFHTIFDRMYKIM